MIRLGPHGVVGHSVQQRNGAAGICTPRLVALRVAGVELVPV